MYYNLFLDDVRMPSHVKWISLPPVEWVIVRSHDEFVGTVLTRGVPAFVSFDHDLSPEHYPTKEQSEDDFIDYAALSVKTGFHSAMWLLDFCLDNHSSTNSIVFPRYAVHSLSLAGKKNIIDAIENCRNLSPEIFAK